MNGKNLIEIGYAEAKSLGLALLLAEKHLNHLDEAEAFAFLKGILSQPTSFVEDKIWCPLAKELIQENTIKSEIIELPEEHGEYKIYGGENIDEGAHEQMRWAMRLPVTVAGALMPDAHQGYGLPIGGVLATHNAIIPYGVGVDIGCRMALSVFDIPAEHFTMNESKYQRELIAYSNFGAGNRWSGKMLAEHEVIDRDIFNANPLLKSLQQRASQQLGTSGGGNHFVEWGFIDFDKDDKALGVVKGKYVALLTHSGSRGLGAMIAGHYTKIAKESCKLPQQAANLAYLDLNSAEGMEYWMAMNLAGDYASACHQIIHDRLTKAIGGQLLCRVENHHNFAWKEMHDGEEVIVHRKGATPASKGVLGIIPGSMTAPGFLVRGKGDGGSLHSASHGAGRVMSRTAAVKTFKRDELRSVLADHGVKLIGGGIDEAPMVYKNIFQVMEAQRELVDVVATFTPKMVRMADDGSRED
jgi:tRNA-splicing ligase RtcB (3'-phosphate/5'-hydroxy nucleic acid ligase)